jgi:hypothetical protein
MQKEEVKAFDVFLEFLNMFLLLLRMEPIADLLGDQGGVAASAVVDDEINLEPGLHGRVYDFCHVLDHLRIQHDPGLWGCNIKVR